MKRVDVILLTVAMISIFSSDSFAAQGWQGPMKVISVVAHGSAYLIDTDSPINDCGQVGRFTIRQTTPMSSDIYKMAMTALLTGRIVYIYADAAQGCSVSGMVSTLMIMK